MAELKPKRPRSRPYPPELRSRALRLVQETIEQEGSSYGVVVRVSRQLGIAPETVRSWIRRAGVTAAARPAGRRTSVAG